MVLTSSPDVSVVVPICSTASGFIPFFMVSSTSSKESDPHPPNRTSATPKATSSIPVPQVMTPPYNHPPHLGDGDNSPGRGPRAPLPTRRLVAPRRAVASPSRPEDLNRVDRTASPRTAGGRRPRWPAPSGDDAVAGSVQGQLQGVLDGADGLDLLVGALRSAAAHDLEHIGGHAPAVDHGVARGLHHGRAAGLGVAVLARGPGGALDLDLPGAELLELGQGGLALLEAGARRLEG